MAKGTTKASKAARSLPKTKPKETWASLRLRAEEDLKFLMSVTDMLSQSLDYQTTLKNLVKMIVPYFADWCSIDIVDERGKLQRVSVEHIDPEKVKLAYDLQKKYPPDSNAPSGAYHVVKTGVAEMMEEIPEELLKKAAGNDPEKKRLIKELHLKSYIAAPLIAQGGVLGVISFVMAESDRRYNSRDLLFAKELASRAAVYMDHARLYTELKKQLEENIVDLQKAQTIGNIGSWKWDIHTNAVTWSDEMYRIYGFAPGQFKVTFEKFLQSVHPFDQERVGDIIKDALQNKKTFTFEHRIIRPDGSRRILRARGGVTTGHKGKVVGMVGTGQDITQEKELEKQLRKWGDIFKNARWGLLIGSPDGKRLEMMNPAFAQMMGYTVEELQDKPVEMLIPPPLYAEHRKAVERIRHTGHLVWETMALRKDKSTFPIQIDLTVVKDDENKPLYYVGSVRDISQRREAEKELRRAHEELEQRVQQRTEELGEANELLARELLQREKVEQALQQSNLKISAILGSITDAYLKFDTKWNLVDLNRQAEIILDQPREKMLGRNFWKEFPAVKKSDFYRQYAQAAASRSSAHFEAYLEPADKWFEVHVYPSGEGTEVYLRDITSRKIAEQNLQNTIIEIERERAKGEALLSSIGEGIVAVDNNGKVLFLNKIAEEMFGVAGFSAIGKHADEVCELVDSSGKKIQFRSRPLSISLKKKQRVIDKSLFVKRGSKKFPVAITATPITGSNGEIIGIVSVYRDIAKEREVDKAKNEFVALASHQLRTPLTITSWYTEKLVQEPNSRLEMRKKYLNELYHANQRMIDLVNTLLDTSRLELGTFSIEPQPTNFAEIADTVLQELAPRIEEKKLRILKKYDAEFPLINADRKLIQIIFQNLIGNAVKYNEQKGIISIYLVQEDDHVLIKIADTGFGIPQRQQAKVFDKLFRADNARERESDGTGLGLYIVKSILDQVGGQIWFESVEGEGTTFYVTLPLKGMARRVAISNES